MASTDSNKNSESNTGNNGGSSKSARSRAGKAGGKSTSSAKRSAARSNGSKRSSSNRGGNRRSASNGSNNLIPYLSSTAASLIGAGIAIGIGLFATRRQWMPYTEEFNEYLHDRWENLSSSSDDDFDDDEDFDRWPAGEEPAPATFPGDGIRPTA